MRRVLYFDMTRFGMLGLALGYLIWYVPYAGLVRALSDGLLPGLEPVRGLVLLPAAALGTLVGSLVFLTVSGWWRYARRGLVAGRFVFWPGRTAVVAGLFMALVIATTTINYTFAGVTILFMLLMMRGGVLIISPLVDAARRRPVRVHAWIALILSLTAVLIALADVDNYALSVGAVCSLAVYLLGYLGRFEIMSRVAKTGDQRIDRRYLVEEQAAAAVWQVLLCAALAITGFGPFDTLREGFTSFLLTPAVVPAFAIGLLYEAVFIYGTLIYLDPREYAWCVPANRCASVLAGVIASFGLAWIAGIPAPGAAQLAAIMVVGLAILALSYPSIRTGLAQAAVAWEPPQPPIPASRPGLLFVCSGNTGRSAMAEAIARHELVRAGATGGTRTDTWVVGSAGLSVRRPGEPMAEGALAALSALGVPAGNHRARQLTWQMCHDGTTLLCMTRAQRTAIRQIAPEAYDRVFCLDPARDIPDPSTSGEPSAFLDAATTIRDQIRSRLRTHAGGSVAMHQP